MTELDDKIRSTIRELVNAAPPPPRLPTNEVVVLRKSGHRRLVAIALAGSLVAAAVVAWFVLPGHDHPARVVSEPPQVSAPPVEKPTTSNPEPTTTEAPVPLIAPGAAVPVTAVRTASFVDRTVAFALTAAPQLAESTDGGRTWRAKGGRLPMSPNARFSTGLTFVSSSTGFIYGDHLVETFDGGQTWRAIGGVDGGVVSVEARGDHAWAITEGCGGQCLYRGPISAGPWRLVRSGHGDYGASVSVVSAQAAFFTDRTSLARTLDGGQTWSEPRLPDCSWSAMAVAAVTVEHLWIACFGVGADSVPLSWFESTDGAATWRLRGSTGSGPAPRPVGVPASVDHAGGFQALADGTLLMDGTKIDSLWISHSAGSQWRQVLGDDTGFDYAVQFIDNSTGWALSSAGLYRTDDGGNHWTVVWHRPVP